jgi:hypothetical protein
MISHTSKQQFAIGIAFALFAGVAWSADRTWTDATGEFSVIAELVGVRGDKVVLRRQNGKQITVPLAKLSEKDQRFLKQSKSEASVAEGEASAKGISEVAGKFFTDLRNSDRTESQQLLTKKAMPLMKGPRSPLAQLPKPSVEENAI